MNFQNSPPFGRSACFYMSISESFKHFQFFDFKTDFLKNENFFQKLGECFLVENTKIENVSFSYKTTIAEVNVKTNRMVTTK